MIINCPYCILNGFRKNLAEILPDGSIKVLRMVTIRMDETNEVIEQRIDSTIIQAQEFNLICGTCQNIVVYKKPIIPLPQVNIMTAWGTMLTHYAKL